MAEDDNTRRLELIILIQGAGCSQSLDSFESLFEPDAHRGHDRISRFLDESAGKRGLGNSYSAPRGDPRVTKAGFGSGQWQACDQQSSRIIAVKILRSVAGVVHLSDCGLNSRLPRSIGKVSIIHPTINTALSCHLVFHNSLEKSKRAVDSVNLTKK